jgi:hypothetical protein
MRERRSTRGVTIQIGLKAEVNMDFVDPNNARTSAYECVVNHIDVDAQRAHIFFDDDPVRRVIMVSLNQLAPPSYPVTDAVIREGDHVEVRWRTDADSPYGWWSGRVVSIDAKRQGYVVAFDLTPHMPEFFNKIHVRPAVFKYI